MSTLITSSHLQADNHDQVSEQPEVINMVLAPGGIIGPKSLVLAGTRAHIWSGP